MYLRGLGVHNVLVPGDPQPRMSLKHAHHLERLEVVHEDVGEPEQVDEFQVDGDEGLVPRVRALPAPGARPGEAGVAEDPGRDVEPGLSPHHIEVGTELDPILLEKWSQIRQRSV